MPFTVTSLAAMVNKLRRDCLLYRANVDLPKTFRGRVQVFYTPGTCGNSDIPAKKKKRNSQKKKKSTPDNATYIEVTLL